MRENKMAYFWGLVKKEFIEIRYSWKNLLIAVFVCVFFFYLITASDMLIHNVGNSCYLITILCTCFTPMNFLTESILSDKRNQTLERYFVAGKIRTVMCAKYVTITIIGIIPFVAFYMTFLLNGIYIITNVYTVINTLLYVWIGSSIAAIVIFLFNDEKTISFAAMPCMLLVLGLIKLNYYIETTYNIVYTCIITMLAAVITLFLCYKFYKNTKCFLKI
jgi:hypothetical protein